MAGEPIAAVEIEDAVARDRTTHTSPPTRGTRQPSDAASSC
jgi:hypothetical protein